MNKNNSLKQLVMTAAVVLAIAGRAQATFTTGSFTTAADLGLPTANTIVKAINLGTIAGPANAPSVTFGGVLFAAYSGEFNPAITSYWVSPLPTFSDAGLNTLADSWVLGIPSLPATNAISGLTVGHSYRLQLITWDGDSGVQNSTYRGTTTITAGADSLTGYNGWATMGLTPGTFATGEGSYINYDFVASGSTLNVSITPDAGGSFILSALDVQDLTVPEPSTFMLLGLGGLLMWRRFRRNK